MENEKCNELKAYAAPLKAVGYNRPGPVRVALSRLLNLVLFVLVAFVAGVLAQKNCPFVQKLTTGCCVSKCECGCEETGKCSCESCNKHTGDNKKKGGCCSMKSIEAEEIVLSSPGSDKKITLRTSKDHAGIWVANGQKCISIYSDDQQTFLGAYKDVANPGHGCDAAISVDDDGGVIQMSDKSGDLSIFGRENIGPKGAYLPTRDAIHKPLNK